MAGSKLSLFSAGVDEVSVGVFDFAVVPVSDFLAKKAGPLDTIALCCDKDVQFSDEEEGKGSMDSQKSSHSKVSLRQEERSVVSAGRGGGHEIDRSNGYK
jgi:hypothetical protein